MLSLRDLKNEILIFEFKIDPSEKYRKFDIFKCVQASLKESVSVRWSVGPSVCWSIGLSFLNPFFFVLPKMEENSQKGLQIFTICFFQSFTLNLSFNLPFTTFLLLLFFYYLSFAFFLLQYFYPNLSFTISLSQSFFQYFFHHHSFTISLSQSLSHDLSFTISL